MRDALLQVTYPAVGSNTPTPIIHVERLDINSTSKEGSCSLRAASSSFSFPAKTLLAG